MWVCPPLNSKRSASDGHPCDALLAYPRQDEDDNDASMSPVRDSNRKGPNGITEYTFPYHSIHKH